MCRWLIYHGDRILLADLLTRTRNCLVHQSYDAKYIPHVEKSKLFNPEDCKMRNHVVNADGFGVAWYDCSDDTLDTPALFKATTPAWSNENLHELSRVVFSTTVLAHVRAATPGLAVLETNCHPFRMGVITFMHNGGIAGFKLIKRAIAQSLREEIFHQIRGTTDSEYVFGVFMNHLSLSESYSADQLAATLKLTMYKIMALQRQYGITEYSSMNFAVSDGRNFVCTRARNCKTSDPPTLYYCAGSEFTFTLDSDYRMNQEHPIDTIICASEPLTYDEASWKLLPKDSMLIVERAPAAGQPIKYRIDQLCLHDEFEAWYQQQQAMVLPAPSLSSAEAANSPAAGVEKTPTSASAAADKVLDCAKQLLRVSASLEPATSDCARWTMTRGLSLTDVCGGSASRLAMSSRLANLECKLDKLAALLGKGELLHAHKEGSKDKDKDNVNAHISLRKPPPAGSFEPQSAVVPRALLLGSFAGALAFFATKLLRR